MIDKQYIIRHLHCSEVYANKLIESAQGDEEYLYDLFIQKYSERKRRKAMTLYEVD
ncbi:hypothetical protein MTQ91_13035 [Staphylococcus hyicus]|nr:MULTISPECIES: hypothetical protein [Staphylococcus]MCO4332835.1 hypothetical protein [Staphylococcus hyicus]MCO4334397.1 hypothetical protein [Staphylococcus hyicus]MDP4447488.1 hypothetical protein [Staphylococcus hyicus]MDP4467983.1 hypothetical protein [Staphylococcus hyicus]MDU0452313.1 hypothetical protein [Staphylococcus chromogenes]